MTEWKNRVRNIESTPLSRNWGKLDRNVFEYQRSDGSWQQQTRETYDRGDGAAVLAYDPDRGTVLLIRQFRFPAFKSGHAEPLIEVCAGLLDADDPVTCIRKEAEEEMGVAIETPQLAMAAFMSPGSVVEKLHLFVARYRPGDRHGAGGGHAAEGEDIEVLELPFDEALAMSFDGRICDAKTIMLIHYAALKGLLPTTLPVL